MANKKLEHQVIPDIEDWPIYKIHQQRKEFVEEIEDFTIEKLMNKPTGTISNMIARTIYLEQIRMKEEPWKVDPPNEKLFWKKMRKRLVDHSLDQDEPDARIANHKILQQIVNRYSEEIVGTFKIKTFLFARKFLNVFFARLLNATGGKNFGKFNAKRRLHEKLTVQGEVEKVRSLMTKGTVVVVPTHFSNLDSILIGYALDTVVGLPSFSYGAGLNLYNTGYTAYFMNRLGAYRIDRRKKNAIYLETLKGMSKLSIEHGVNSLFFPGGTRSRSGALETKLKLGMLGTAVEAQRSLYQKGKDEKVFIVPLVLGYHFVLEAKFLIEQHLRKTGEEHYVKPRDESYSWRRWSSFFWSLFSESNEITMSIGKPMDVMGNFVDENGISFSRNGNPLEVKDYFVSNGKVVMDLQRESEYTKLLADRIVERFHKDNIVLTSHLTAFAAFNMLQEDNQNLDIYGLLRLPSDEYIFDEARLINVVEQLKARLIEMQKQGKIKLSDPIYEDALSIIRDGAKRLGSYHAAKPLRFNKAGQIISESFQVLYFYHNRLSNYGLEEQIDWKGTVIRDVETVGL